MPVHAPETMMKASSARWLRRALQKTAPEVIERRAVSRRRHAARATDAPPKPPNPLEPPAPPPRPETRPPGPGVIPEEPMAPQPDAPRPPDPRPVEPPTWAEE